MVGQSSSPKEVACCNSTRRVCDKEVKLAATTFLTLLMLQLK